MAKRRTKSRARRPPRRRRNRKVRSLGAAQPSIGRLVATGVKNLLSLVPAAGPALASIADFAFKTIGLTSSEPVQLKFEQATTYNYAVAAKIQIKPVILLVGSKAAVQWDADRKIGTAYRDGRVISITIQIRPGNKMMDRNGEWTLSFQPYFADEDANGATGNVPILDSMMRTYMTRTGQASQVLKLTYTPVVSDGRPYFYLPLNAAYGEVTVFYEQPNRAGYDVFTADDFNCDMIVSGKIEVRSTTSSLSTGVQFDTTVNDLLKNVEYFLRSTKTKGIYGLNNTSTSTSVSGAGLTYTRVSGNVISGSKSETSAFEFMSLEDT